MLKVPNRFNNQSKVNHETGLQILIPKKISEYTSDSEYIKSKMIKPPILLEQTY